MKRLYFRLIIGVFCLMAVFVILSIEECAGETWYVDENGDGDYTTIQIAIENADDGDLIRVWEGDYFENVVVDKSVSLIGNGSVNTTIDGGGNGDVVKITADWINMSGFRITGSGSSGWPDIDSGINVESNHNMISNNNCTNNRYGIHLYSSNECTIENNTFENNDYGIYFRKSSYNTLTKNSCLGAGQVGKGIYLTDSCNYNTFFNNTCTNTFYGIDLWQSDHNTLTNNSSPNNKRGIRISDSNNNTLINNTSSSNESSAISLVSSKNNTFKNNKMLEGGIGIIGSSLENYITHNIDSTNTVNGKPVYYYKDSSGITVPSGAGQIILANCSRIVVENQNCSIGSVGLAIVFSSNLTISNNTFYSYSGSGISLYYSNFSTFSNNTCSNNHHGIYLKKSNNNTFANNICSSNYQGIILLDSNQKNVFINNTCNSNKHSGISIQESDFNILSNNVCSSNQDGGIALWDSSNNTLANNTCNSNWDDGIYLKESDYNILINNSCSSNDDHGINLEDSNKNSITKTICSLNTECGIYLKRSNYNTLTNVTSFANKDHGICIDNSVSNTLTNNTYSSNNNQGINIIESSFNTLSNNQLLDNGFYLWGDSLEHWNTHIIDAANSVDGKPIYYFTNTEGITVPSGGGQVILANCSEMVVENQNCSNTSIGILVVYSSNITFYNNTCSYNDDDGIYLLYSNNNTITNNAIAYNINGIHLYNSNYNTLIDNSISNHDSGILLDSSKQNILTNNTCSSNNDAGLFLSSSDYNTLSNNICFSNYFSGIYINIYSNNNTLTNNTCTSNIYAGIYIFVSDYNTLTNNTCVSNNITGISILVSSWNNLFNNIITDNGFGIYLLNSENTSAHHNNIFNNTEFGINATDNGGYFVNATHNRWGDDSGPYHPINNTHGKGDNVTDYVEYNPWIGKEEPGVNEIPLAFIGSITPNPGTKGESITFHGYGTDDGSIIKYSWHSTIDGELYYGPSPIFFTSNLTAGNHIISLKVQDDFGLWSDEDSRYLPILPIISMDQPPILIVLSPENNSEVSGIITITGSAYDPEGNITYVEMSLDGGKWFRIGNSTNWNYELDTSQMKEGNIVITIRAFDGHHCSDTQELLITVKNRDGGDEGSLFPGPVPIAIGIVVVGLLYLVNSWESLRYSLLSILTIPLYTKLEKDEILDHSKRRDIYSYIVKNPGVNYTRILKTLELGNGTMVHHLNILESQGLIRSRKEMGRKIFIPNDMDWNPDNGVTEFPISPIQSQILNYLEENGPESRKDILKALALKQRTMSYSIERLKTRGLITSTRKGRNTIYDVINTKAEKEN